MVDETEKFPRREDIIDRIIETIPIKPGMGLEPVVEGFGKDKAGKDEAGKDEADGVKDLGKYKKIKTYGAESNSGIIKIYPYLHLVND